MCGMVNYYIFDYTNAAARTHWAKAVARLFNEAQAETSQWDGAEIQPSKNFGWDIRHSANTFDSGLYTQDAWHMLWVKAGQHL